MNRSRSTTIAAALLVAWCVFALALVFLAGRASAQATCTTWQNPIPGSATVYAPDAYPSFVLLLEDGTSLEVGPVVLGQEITAPQPIVSAVKCRSLPEPTPTPTVEPTPTEVPVTPQPEPTPTPTPERPEPTPTAPPAPTPTATVTISTPTPTVPPDSSPTPPPDSSPTPTPTATPETPTATPTATPTTPMVEPTPTPTTPLAETGANVAGFLFVGGALVLAGGGLWALSKLEGES